MVDLSVALTWIAISAASVKGLSAFARAVTAENIDGESTSLAGEGAFGPEALYPMAAPVLLPSDRR